MSYPFNTTPYNGIPQRLSVAQTPIVGSTIIGGPRGSIVNRTIGGVRTSTRASVLSGQPRASRLVNGGQQRFIEERYVGEKVIGITENRLEERIISTARPEIHTTVNTVETFQDEPIIKEVIVEKEIEIIVEKRVRVERFVDVPYDVIVETPIEKVIEKEITIEKLVEIPYERIVEVPVERIVDVPVERIVHKPVEIEKRVERPYETVVERKIEEPFDNIIYHDNYVDCQVENLHHYPGATHLPTEVITHQTEKIVERPVYIDNIIERVVDVPIEKIIQVPIEKLIQKPVEHVIERPVYIDNIIEREVQIPVEKIIEQPVEHIVERPVYIDNIIERPIPIEVIREEVIQVPVEHIVEHPVYIDNIIEVPVEVIVENPVPVEKIIEIPIAQNIETHIAVDEVTAFPNEIIAEIPVPIEAVRRLPIEYVVKREIAVPVETIIEVSVPVVQKDVHERIIERPVEWERIVQKAVPIEKIVEVEVERVTEQAIYTEKIIEVQVPFDRVIEQKYEVIIENHIEVPVEKIITVPIRTYIQTPVETRNYFEKDINVVSTVVQPVPGLETEEHFEVDDQLLATKTVDNRNKTSVLVAENRNLQNEASRLNVNHTPAFNSLSSANAQLKSELSELESRLNIISKDKDRLVQSINSKTVQHINYTVPDPSHVPLRAELESLVHENRALLGTAQSQTHVTNATADNLSIAHPQVFVQPHAQVAVHQNYFQAPVIQRGGLIQSYAPQRVSVAPQRVSMAHHAHQRVSILPTATRYSTIASPASVIQKREAVAL